MTCSECGRAIDGWSSFITENGEVCGDCWNAHGWECEECGAQYLDTNELSYSSRGDTVCLPCLREREEEDERDNEYEGNGCTCPSCRRDRMDSRHRDEYDGRELINNYSFRPRPIFHGDGPLYLGPEIEIEAGGRVGRAAKIAASHLGDLGYLKDDGSINSGFEIVTHPMAYGWALDQFPWDMFGELAEVGCEAASTCGMHVHVSRAGFSGPCHVHRWLKWFYRHEGPICRIARRSSSQWAQFDRNARKQALSVAKGGFGANNEPTRTSDFIEAERSLYYDLDRLADDHYWGRISDQEYGRLREERYQRFMIESTGRAPTAWGLKLDTRADYGRYVAVNTQNDATFELRVFASSLVPQEIQAAFGLATASIEFTREIDSHKILTNKALEWPAFVDYVSSHDQYRPLMIEMENRACVS